MQIGSLQIYEIDRKKEVVKMFAKMKVRKTDF